mmetsp:Transcript_11271/g.21270  ORF Transcript_11271/g.21270 Transcript_11271/m.21270 type:complete len:106 (-) Transcript_11271:17-334(-)
MFSTNTVNSVSEHDIEVHITSRPGDDNALHAPEGDFENATFAGDTSPKMSPSVLDPNDGNISSPLANPTTTIGTHNNIPFNNTLQPPGNPYVTSAYKNNTMNYIQ